MLPRIEHYLTNWTDGMKVHRQHFANSENALIDQMRDAIALNLPPASYGLLQPLPGGKSSLECMLHTAVPGSFSLSLSLCRAITAGGHRIEILPGQHPELLSSPLSIAADQSEDRAWLAVLRADPFDRLPGGPADPAEVPPRHPYCRSHYSLHLLPEQQLQHADPCHLPVARFVFSGGSLSRDAAYIPPCAVMGAHPACRQLYNTIAERFNTIQECSLQMVQKVVENGTQTSLAQSIRLLCEQTALQIASEYFMIRSLYRQQSPVLLAGSVVRLTSRLQLQLAMMHSRDKEELLQYFSHWNELSPARFSDLLLAVSQLNYEHEQVRQSFDPLLRFLDVWSALLEKLRELKLAGQMRESFDFGGRTIETPRDQGKGRFSIFD